MKVCFLIAFLIVSFTAVTAGPAAACCPGSVRIINQTGANAWITVYFAHAKTQAFCVSSHQTKTQEFGDVGTGAGEIKAQMLVGGPGGGQCRGTEVGAITKTFTDRPRAHPSLSIQSRTAPGKIDFWFS
jgi:hypothetical protein